jgi:RNA polymerase sigma-70 factor (ECF subfamily)
MTMMSLAAEPADKAIPHLLEQYGGQIYGLGLRMCGNPEDAQDLMQDVFLQAFRKWEQFEGRSSPSTWLYTIAARVCQRRHRLRAGQPRALESLSTLLPSGEEVVVDLPSDGDTPLDVLERNETRDTVQLAITRLSPKFRLPLILKELMDLSIGEIAEVLGLKEATVKTRLHRARLYAARELANGLPKKPAPPPNQDRAVCLDLLRAKQEAMDRGVTFPVAQQELCVRCQSLFATLDLTKEACRRLGEGELPQPVRDAILAEMKRSSGRRQRKKQV